MNILDYIPTGRENAILREELSRLTELGDRAMRKEIERMRKKGVFIISDDDTPGYWLPETLEEKIEFTNRYFRKGAIQVKTAQALWASIAGANIKIDI